MYDGPSVKEKINLSLFSLPNKREWNKIEYIFSPQKTGVKINSNVFSLANKREWK